MMHLTRVLLPAPFSPSRACTLPGRSWNDTSSSAARLPKRLLISRAQSCGGSGRAGLGVTATAGSWAGTVAGRLMWGSGSARGNELGGLIDGSTVGGAAQRHDDQRESIGGRVEQIVAGA